MTKTAKRTAALIAAITAYAAEFDAAGDHEGFLSDFEIVVGIDIEEMTHELQTSADELKEMRLNDEAAEAEEAAEAAAA